MKEIKSDLTPAAVGPYSAAIATNGLVFVSGQLPLDAKGVMPEGIEAQAKQSLSNVKALVEAAGSDLSKVVKTTVLLADINDFGKVNEVYGTFFKAPFPARACYEVAALPKGALVEIECIALC